MRTSFRRKRSRNTNAELNQNVHGEVGKNGRNAAGKNPPLNLFGFQVPTGRRSNCVRARSSAWRFTGVILPSFEEHARLDLNVSNGKELRRYQASKKKRITNNFIAKHRSDDICADGVICEEKNHLASSANQTLSDGETRDRGSSSDGLISSDGQSDQCASPREAWVQCDDCGKWRRIAPELIDQIRETKWTCQSNVNKYFSDCSIPQKESNTRSNLELGISGASCGQSACGGLPGLKQNQSTQARQSSWALIKSNLYLHRSRKTQTVDEVMVCHCKTPSNGRMGCGARCLNRMLNVECVHGTCPCGERCSNQQFQKQNYTRLKLIKCGRKGFGIQSLEDISKGQFLIEYVGEVLDMHSYKSRQRDYALQGHKHFYFMMLNGNEVIHSSSKGNLSRFINHSCDPNCQTEKWVVNGEICVGFFAVRDIKKGEEITFDYNYVRVSGAAVKRCLCGSSNCHGYIGGDPANYDEIAHDGSDDEYSEPIMICEDIEMGNDWKEIMSNSVSDGDNEPPENRQGRNDLVYADGQFESEPSKILIREGVDFDGHLDIYKYNVESLPCSILDTFGDKSEGGISYTHSSVRDANGSLQAEDIVHKGVSWTQHSDHGLKITATSFPIKLRHDGIQARKMLKCSTVESKLKLPKSHFLFKNHSSSSSVKKRKLKANVMKDKVTVDMQKLDAAPHKFKHAEGLSLNNHVKAVEEKLHELLNSEGGISKQTDATQGYLKLLLLTAASRTDTDGESIWSNCALSMILDALLKTKSRRVLVDIIKKNGLQMLHDIMKRCNKDFTRTPILRKLLKVFDYLALRKILTSEHINGGPPCPEVESFTDSILALTEHADKQVHRMARKFRDTCIPRSLRKNCFTVDDKVKSSQFPGYGSCRPSAPCFHLSNRRGKPGRDAPKCFNWKTVDVSSGATGTRRRNKSECDIPSEEYQQPRITTHTSADRAPKANEDSPPSPVFSFPCKHKTRWDIPDEEHQHSRITTNTSGDRAPKTNEGSPLSPGFLFQRKHKSRWDIPAEEHQQPRITTDISGEQALKTNNDSLPECSFPRERKSRWDIPAKEHQQPRITTDVSGEQALKTNNDSLPECSFPRKRNSRWDIPAKEHQQPRMTTKKDSPPGSSLPCNAPKIASEPPSAVLHHWESTKQPSNAAASADPQRRCPQLETMELVRTVAPEQGDGACDAYPPSHKKKSSTAFIMNCQQEQHSCGHVPERETVMGCIKNTPSSWIMGYRESQLNMIGMSTELTIFRDCHIDEYWFNFEVKMEGKYVILI